MSLKQRTMRSTEACTHSHVQHMHSANPVKSKASAIASRRIELGIQPIITYKKPTHKYVGHPSQIEPEFKGSIINESYISKESENL